MLWGPMVSSCSYNGNVTGLYMALKIEKREKKQKKKTLPQGKMDLIANSLSIMTWGNRFYMLLVLDIRFSIQ